MRIDMHSLELTTPMPKSTLYTVTAFDNDNDEIRWIGPFDLNKDKFSDSLDIKNRLQPAIDEYNQYAIFPVRRLEVARVEQVANAVIEEDVETKKTYKVGRWNMV